MKQRRMNPLLLMGLIGVFTIGSTLAAQVYRAFWGDKGIWWTPPGMSLKVEETGNDVAISIGGKLLQKHLAEGTLFAVDPNGTQYRVVSRDVGVRLNNWERVKASLLTTATLSSFCFCVSLTLLILGLIQWEREKADG
jgi:hypothetical protein